MIINQSFADSNNLSPRKNQSYRETLLSPRKKKPTIFQRMTNIITRKLYKFPVVELEEDSEQIRLENKRLELISDPVYSYSLPEGNRKTFQQFVIKYSSITEIMVPERISLIYWNIAVMVVLMYYYFEIGLVLFYGDVVWQAELTYWWSYLFNCFAIIILMGDVLVSLNRGYYQKGVLIMDRKRIYKNYLNYHALKDTLALLVVMLSFISGAYKLIYFKIIFLLKVVNMNTIDVSFQRILQFNQKASAIYLVSRLVILMIMICHYLGGIFYAIDLYVYNTNYYGPNTPNMCWIYNAVAYQQMVLYLPWYTQYLYTMYWAIATMTTIAYGDITPLNPMQTLYVIFMLIISCISFAYILNNIVEILIEARASRQTFMRTLVTMNQFMTEKLITRNMQIRIRAYFQFIWNEEGERNREVEIDMIQNLPAKLKEELLCGVYNKFLTGLLLFRYFPSSILIEVVQLIQEYRCSRNEQLENNPKFIARSIAKGQITFYFSQLELATISTGSFGILEFFKQTPLQLGMRSVGDTLIYTLDRDQFEALVYTNPTYRQIFRYICDLLQDYNSTSILASECFICGQNTHFCKYCPTSHYVVSKYRLNLKMEKIKQRRFKGFKRNRKYTQGFLQKNVLSLDRQQYLEELQNKQRKKELREENIDYFITNELNISQDFKGLEDYVEETESLLKYIKHTILGLETQALESDKRQDYEYYFPQSNLNLLTH